MPGAFNRDSMAVDYGQRHKRIDPGIREIHYLPTGAPPNEIRFVEVNESITATTHPEPIDFGVDAGTPNAHRLVVFDVTPDQWQAIRGGTLPLPVGWSLEGSQEVGGKHSRKR